jgi:hypothetical protein
MTTAAQPLPISPGATLDISWDWTAWLAAAETIASRTVTADVPLTKNSDAVNGAVVTAFVTVPGLSGIAYGATLVARCSITTSAGRTDSRRFEVVVTDR